MRSTKSESLALIRALSEARTPSGFEDEAGKAAAALDYFADLV